MDEVAVQNDLLVQQVGYLQALIQNSEAEVEQYTEAMRRQCHDIDRLIEEKRQLEQEV